MTGSMATNVLKGLKTTIVVVEVMALKHERQ